MLLKKSELIGGQTIKIGGSKSITNRLLILDALYGNLRLENISDSEDSALLSKGLESSDNTVDIHHAGTAMRFLTAFYAIQPGKEIILTGSERMQQRPIAPLVNALQQLGAEISYVKKEGFPPLKISGKKIVKSVAEVEASVSSQFITALILIGSSLQDGLELHLKGDITSRPYLEMTLKILNDIGIQTQLEDNTVKIKPTKDIHKTAYAIESDWSSASYYYSFAAVGRTNISLKNFKNNSLQGDRALVEIYNQHFGVESIFEEDNVLTLKPVSDFISPKNINLNLNHCPDIAQTICVTAALQKIPFKITGLATLKVKETDRLQALKNELLKLGAVTKITYESIELKEFVTPPQNISIETYNDHRMAMSFAPACLLYDLFIENPEVVSKSYPGYWADILSILESII